MTREEVEATLDLVDKVATSHGHETLRGLLDRFGAAIPADVRATVMAQVTEEVASRVRAGLDETLSEMRSVVDDPDIVDQVKKVVAQHESTDTVVDPDDITAG